MENASKALIIAGAVLLAIMIISLGVFMVNKLGGTAKQHANMDEEEIKVFNSKLTPYQGKSVSGSRVNALIQLVISINTSAKSSGDATKAVSITIPKESGGTNTIELANDGSTVKGLEDQTRVKTGGNTNYTVKCEYGDFGLIDKIVVTKNP